MGEVIYAGGFAGQNNDGYWLYTNQNYWTMSPYSFNGNNAGMLIVNLYGSLVGYNDVSNTKYGVRPVINLKSDTVFTTIQEEGKGTSTNPYIVE